MSEILWIIIGITACMIGSALMLEKAINDKRPTPIVIVWAITTLSFGFFDAVCIAVNLSLMNT